MEWHTSSFKMVYGTVDEREAVAIGLMRDLDVKASSSVVYPPAIHHDSRDFRDSFEMFIIKYQDRCYAMNLTRGATAPAEGSGLFALKVDIHSPGERVGLDLASYVNDAMLAKLAPSWGRD